MHFLCKSMVTGLFISHKSVSIILFTDSCARNFFFPGVLLQGLTFRLRLVMANPCLAHWERCLTKTGFCIFHMVCPSQLPKTLMADLCSSLKDVAFFVAPKQTFLQDCNNFSYILILNNTVSTFSKKIFCFFQKSPYLLNNQNANHLNENSPLRVIISFLNI